MSHTRAYCVLLVSPVTALSKTTASSVAVVLGATVATSNRAIQYLNMNGLLPFRLIGLYQKCLPGPTQVARGASPTCFTDIMSLDDVVMI